MSWVLVLFMSAPSGLRIETLMFADEQVCVQAGEMLTQKPKRTNIFNVRYICSVSKRT